MGLIIRSVRIIHIDLIDLSENRCNVLRLHRVQFPTQYAKGHSKCEHLAYYLNSTFGNFQPKKHSPQIDGTDGWYWSISTLGHKLDYFCWNQDFWEGDVVSLGPFIMYLNLVINFRHYPGLMKGKN